MLQIMTRRLSLDAYVFFRLKDTTLMSLHSASLTVTPDNLSCRALSLVQTKKVLGDFKVDN